jgi:hypothetical protein
MFGSEKEEFSVDWEHYTMNNFIICSAAFITTGYGLDDRGVGV